MRIGKNRTRYDTAGLQGLLDEAIRCAEDRPSLVKGPSASRPMHVAYWGGSGMDKPRTHWGRRNVGPLPGPWYTSDYSGNTTSPRLLITTPEKIVASLSPMEQLALTEDELLVPVAAMEQIATAMLILAHYSFTPPSMKAYWQKTSYGVPSFLPILGIVQGWQGIQDCRVRVLPRIVDPAPKPPPGSSRKRMEKTYRTGRAAREVRYAPRRLMPLLTEYHEWWLKTKKQRELLLKYGGYAEPYPTVSELAQSLLEHAEDEEGGE